MARLPQPGGDAGNWGSILNDYLVQSHKSDGTLKDNSVTTNVIAPNSVTSSTLASNSVNASSIADGSVSDTKLTSELRTEIDGKLSSLIASEKYGPGGAVYPEQFGAVGDGTANDTNALISAINQASATSMPVILTRRYLFSTIDLQLSDVTIDWKPGSLMLSNQDKTTDIQTFRLRGSRILLHRPTFDFTTTVNIDTDAQTRPAGGDTIRLGGLSAISAAEDIEVIGGLVVNSRNTPLRVRFARSVRISGFRCRESLGNGIMLENVRDGWITRCVTRRTGDDGIVALAGNSDYIAGYSGDIDISNNHVYQSYANGINFTGVDGGVIGSNIIDQTWAPGVRVWKDTTFGLGSCNDIEILPNVIRRAGTYFGAGRYHEVVNAVPHGVYAQGGVERVTLHAQSVISPQGRAVVTVGGGVRRLRGASLPPTLGTGQFISQTGVSIGTTATVVDRLFASPVVIPDPAIVTTLNINCTLAAASSSVRLGIYSDDASVPGTLLIDAGTVDTSTTGLKSLAISQALPVGIYWLVAVGQGGTPTLSTLNGRMPGMPTNQNPSTSTNGYFMSSVSAGLPAQFAVSGTTGSAVAITIGV